jgi:hypothetical protein
MAAALSLSLFILFFLFIAYICALFRLNILPSAAVELAKLIFTNIAYCGGMVLQLLKLLRIDTLL